MNNDIINKHLSDIVYDVNSNNKFKVKNINYIYNYSDQNVKLGKYKVLDVDNSQNKGLSINKADRRLNEILNITNNVNTMIKDCFGEN